MIPKIDSEIGISVYTTSFAGCGGKIKSKDDDFLVSEVLSKNAIQNISADGDYAVYKLKKHGIDTTHSLANVFKKYNLRLKSLGLKDAAAVTEQYVCSGKKLNSIAKISEDKYSLERIGFVKKPLSKKDMIGNQFKIKITDTSIDISKFNEFDKVLNFYGYQRFGSKRPVTHLIGKALLQQDYTKAVNLLLSFTSEYDSPENTKLRKNLSDKSNYSKLLDEIPFQMDLERIVVNQMIQDDDPKKAMRALPLAIRRFYLQAYQSFLFNKTLSMAFIDGEDLFLPQHGDVCYDKNGIIGKFSNEPGQRLSIPFVGYSYYKKTRFHYQISKILESEDVSPKDFFLKEMQEISSEGGFRNSSIKCDDIDITNDLIRFTLSRGSYATIVMREVMKPKDPIDAGF
ncbi:MAG: tRNA pseudouridine(13) synthase TruD [Nitrosopumilaceae archaeon]